MFSIWKWTLNWSIQYLIIAYFFFFFSLCFRFLLFFAVIILCLLYCQDYNWLWSGTTQNALWCTKLAKIPKNFKCFLKPYLWHGLYLRIIEPNWKCFMKHWISSLTGLWLWFQIFSGNLPAFWEHFLLNVLKLLDWFYLNKNWLRNKLQNCSWFILY